MNLNYLNATFSLLRATRRRLKLSIRSRVTNSNDRCCFTIQLRGTEYDTTYYAISITMSVSDCRVNHNSFSVTCRSTIWRRTRSRSSWTWSADFQTLARREMRCTLRPSVTNGSPSTTTTGETFTPEVGTQGRGWSTTTSSELLIPNTGSLAELLDGNLLQGP